MKCDERLEALLNRAGQTISDLPRKWSTCVSEPYTGEQCYKAHGAAWAWYVGEDLRAVPELERHETTRDRMVLRQYILHLTDIIDRMETALENVCGERDYLRHVACGLCFAFREGGEDYCETCMVGDGVPENWRADDDL